MVSNVATTRRPTSRMSHRSREFRDASRDDRLSKTERLATVSSIWFLGRFTAKYEMGMQASLIDHTF